MYSQEFSSIFNIEITFLEKCIVSATLIFSNKALYSQYYLLDHKGHNLAVNQEKHVFSAALSDYHHHNGAFSIRWM